MCVCPCPSSVSVKGNLLFWSVEESFSQDDCWQLSLKEEVVNQTTRERSRFQAKEVDQPTGEGRKFQAEKNGGHWLWDSWKGMRTLGKVKGSQHGWSSAGRKEIGSGREQARAATSLQGIWENYSDSLAKEHLKTSR